MQHPDAEHQPAPPHDEADPRDALLLEDFLPFRLSVLSNTVSKAIARLYADRFGITIPEWRVLAVLGRFGPGSAADICQTTAMDKVQVSRALQRLAAARLITRRIDKVDRRRAVVAMTAKGREVHGEIVPLARSREQILMDGLSDEERETLDHLLVKLERRAESLAGETGER